MAVDPEETPKLELVKTKTRRDGLYVHPKGNLAKQLKVSCASCISGHRSGECNHFDRILLQIRAAGRPSNTCHHTSSCGGACLKQKAFIVPTEEPRWCRDHRSCIENWEYSDHCPPYPVSSAKRKGRSSSPRRASQTSSTLSSIHNGTQDSTSISHRKASSSCCSSGNGAGRVRAPSGSTMPVGQPIMVTASGGQLPASTWTPKSNPVAASFVPTFEAPARPLLPPISSNFMPTSQTQSPHTPFQQVSGFPYFDPYDLSYPQIPSKHTSTYAPSNSYIDDSASYHDDLSSFTLPSTSLPPSASSYPTSATLAATPTILPQTQRPNHQPEKEEPQQCPGNGFQCPCDENCMCVDCYTHGRGWWTFPVALGDAQHALSQYREEPPPPPSRISRSISQAESRPPGLADQGDEYEFDDRGYRAEFVDPQSLFELDPSLDRY